MSDACSLDFKKSIRKTSAKIKTMLGGDNDLVIDRVLSDMEQNLEKAIELHTYYNNHDSPEMVAKIERVVTQHIDDAVVTYHALKTGGDNIAKALEGSDNLDDLKIAFQIRSQEIANTKDRATKDFQANVVDKEVDSRILKSQKLDPRQAKQAKKMFFQIAHKGDSVAIKYLTDKGFTEADALSMIFSAKKDGHISAKAHEAKFKRLGLDDKDVIELNVIAETHKEIEKIMQTKFMAKKPGYAWRKRYAFPVKFDADSAKAMGKEKFHTNLYDPKSGKFIINIDKYSAIKKRLEAADDPVAMRTEIEKEFSERIYKDVGETKYDDSLMSKNASNSSLFQSRDLDLIDDAAEIHFYNTFKSKSDGIFRENLTHLQNQNTQIELRAILGADRKGYMSELRASAERHFQGLNKDAAFFKDFDKTVKSIEHDYNSVLGSSNPLSDTMDDLYVGAHSWLRAVQTTFSTLRNIGIDNTFHAARMHNNIGRNGGFVRDVAGGLNRVATLAGVMMRLGYTTKKMKKIMELMDHNLIEGQIGQHVAWSKVYAPDGGMFAPTSKGNMFTSMFRRAGDASARGVSMMTLADATYKAARSMEFINVAKKWMYVTDTMEAKLLMKEYGMDVPTFMEIRDLGKKLDFDDIDIPNFRKYLEDVSDADMAKFLKKGETSQIAKDRLTRQMWDIFTQMHDDTATRVTQRTGFSLHTGESAMAKATIGMQLKYAGMTLNQQQALLRELKRVSGETNLNTGWKNLAPVNPMRYLNVLKTARGASFALGAIATMQMGGYMRDAMKSLVQGQVPQDPFDKDVLIKAMENSSPLGLYQTLYQGLKYGDSPLEFPVASQVKSVKRLGEAVIEGDNKKAAIAGISMLPDFIPMSRLFINNGSDMSNALKKEYGGIEGHRQVRRRKKFADEKFGKITDNEVFQKFFGNGE